jgi:REP element-mobilizing transposase RayT
MARKPRLHVPGGFYHVILRGNGGQDIFHSVEDSKFFESLVSEGIERFGHRIHCYCWMKNHIHLVIQIANTPLSKIIQNISFRYTLFINNKYDTRGHLFQGRYKAVLVDPENYLLQLIRYIDLNPVRAEIVNKPEEYRWSSHRAYMDKASCGWLTVDYILGLFSNNRAEALKDYQEFVIDGMQQGYRKEVISGSVRRDILGNDRFVEEVLKGLESKSEDLMSMEKIVTAVCKWCSKIRTIIAYLIMEYGNCSLAEYCGYIGRDISTLSNAVRKYRSKLENNTEERLYLAGVKNELGLKNQ